MRRFIFALVGLVALALPVTAEAQQSGLRIGYINSEAILQQAPGVQEAQSQFDQDMQGFQAEVQGMAQELERMIQQYEQQQLTLSPEAKQQRQAAIRQKQQEYQERLQAIDERAGQRQAELVQPVMDSINDIIEQIRAEGNYSFIFNTAAGAIIAADPSLDLTDEVIRRLRTGAGDNASGSR